MEFRELTRKNKQLSEKECIELLKSETRGVLSVVGDGGYPYGMPINYWYNEEDGCIYFHCGKNGHRVDALKANDKVSFCVYDHGVREEGDWALNVKSVIVFGKMELLDDMETIVSVSTALCHKFTQDEAYIEKEIQTHAHATLILKLVPRNLCGKRIKES